MNRPSAVRRGRGILVRGALTLAVAAGALAWSAGFAAAAPGSVLVDDYAGSVLGTRTVTAFPAEQPGTGIGDFDEAGGLGTVVVPGADDAPAGVELAYRFVPTDLTGGAGDRLVLDLAAVGRTPEAADRPAASVSVSVDDDRGGSAGVTAPVAAGGPSQLVVDLSCSASAIRCLGAEVDPRRAVGIRIVVSTPDDVTGFEGAQVQLDSLRTVAATDTADPAASAPPTPPAVVEPSTTPLPTGGVVTSPEPTISGSPGTSQGPEPIPSPGTSAPASPSGAGTATPPPSTQPDPSPTTATTSAGPRPTPAAPAPDPTTGSTPVFDNDARWSLPVGESGSFTVRTRAEPTATLTAAGLPPGLTLTDHGDGTATIAGTPAFDGLTRVLLRATNEVGTATQQLGIDVSSPPAFTSDTSATFERGAPGSFDLTTTGTPTPRITIGGGRLPAGLSLVDHGDGTATIAGTPTGPGGQVGVTITATSTEGSADSTITLLVEDAPSFTSGDQARFAAGTNGRFDVTTAGQPTPQIVVDSALPDWLAFDDFGDGTGTLRTVGPAPAGATAAVTLRAMNAVGADVTQTIQVGVD